MRTFSLIYKVVVMVASLLLLAPAEVSAQGSLGKKILQKGKTKGRKAAKRMVGGGDIDLSAYTVEEGYEIIGFEPSWLLSSARQDKYAFNLLNTLVLGEYDINTRTGDPRNEQALANIESNVIGKVATKTGKKEANVLQVAVSQNPEVNILLHVTCYGDFGDYRTSKRQKLLRSFLKNIELEDQFQFRINEILNRWSDAYSIPRSRLGIVLDFKYFQEGTLKDIIEFVHALRSDLGAETLIYFKVPPFRGPSFRMSDDEIESFATLNQHIDKLLVEAYGLEKQRRGPAIWLDNTDIQDEELTLENSLFLYDQLGFSQDSTAVVLPMYGVRYVLNEDESDYILDPVQPYFPLDDPPAGYSGQLRYPTDSSLVFYNGSDQASYYDNFNSLYKKFSLLKDSMGVKNLGMWGLGYYRGGRDKRTQEMQTPWHLVTYTYGKEKPRMGWVVAGWLTFFIPLGFVYSVFNYWQVRNVLAKYRKFYVRWQIGLILTLIIWFIVADVIEGTRGPIGYAVGAFVLFLFFLRIFVRRIISKSRRYTRYARYIK